MWKMWGRLPFQLEISFENRFLCMPKCLIKPEFLAALTSTDVTKRNVQRN